jgi:peptidoglycan/LPS O-acetylase OafA/YrhL
MTQVLRQAINTLIWLQPYNYIIFVRRYFPKLYKHVTVLSVLARRIFGMIFLIISLAGIYFEQHVTHGPLSGGLYMLLFFVALTINEDLFKNKTPKLLLFLVHLIFPLFNTHFNEYRARQTSYRNRLPNGWFKLALYCLISIVLAYASYHFIERPFFKRNTKRAVLE